MRLCLQNVRWLFIVFAMLIVTFSFAYKASAHGYVKSPESRALLCAQKVNHDCGSIIYEPQSLEASGNFPSGGPTDGKIASAGGAFPKLDEQSAKRWAKVPMKSGANMFTWKFTAAHATDKFEYYITKEGWNPNKPLKRADLELFCTVKSNGKRPSEEMSHRCVVPEREGYHIIVAYWEIGDTPNAFYNVIDANFDGDFVKPTPETPEGIAWSSSKVYVEGDKVTYNGVTYQAKWWTQGDQPGKAQVWALVDNRVTKIPAWDINKVYVSGDKVSYNGTTYQAKWWTKGERPDKAQVWTSVEGVNKPLAWDAEKVYIGGDKAFYKEATYQAKWWTKGDEPVKTQVWALIK
ncbi:lytic polysaccharide monooxygenase [Metasolibacillus meyeri]|uniref:Lytic polysaccharide monooxygenase n=1 Tax=Metasolibacillus meyeri TaxID=1071052 RepID=A0AAW9NQH9_9BACL|nr:lytic polysaccharide monooxygenase [Metasolibacillus meyeri]MEC1178004.1 lytic polysaccharide monooxygenase [Metasolibacillus meyeri]